MSQQTPTRRSARSAANTPAKGAKGQPNSNNQVEDKFSPKTKFLENQIIKVHPIVLDGGIISSNISKDYFELGLRVESEVVGESAAGLVKCFWVGRQGQEWLDLQSSGEGVVPPVVCKFKAKNSSRGMIADFILSNQARAAIASTIEARAYRMNRNSVLDGPVEDPMVKNFEAGGVLAKPLLCGDLMIWKNNGWKVIEGYEAILNEYYLSLRGTLDTYLVTEPQTNFFPEIFVSSIKCLILIGQSRIHHKKIGENKLCVRCTWTFDDNGSLVAKATSDVVILGMGWGKVLAEGERDWSPAVTRDHLSLAGLSLISQNAFSNIRKNYGDQLEAVLAKEDEGADIGVPKLLFGLFAEGDEGYKHYEDKFALAVTFLKPLCKLINKQYDLTSKSDIAIVAQLLSDYNERDDLIVTMKKLKKALIPLGTRWTFLLEGDALNNILRGPLAAYIGLLEWLMIRGASGLFRHAREQPESAIDRLLANFQNRLKERPLNKTSLKSALIFHTKTGIIKGQRLSKIKPHDALKSWDVAKEKVKELDYGIKMVQQIDGGYAIETWAVRVGASDYVCYVQGMEKDQAFVCPLEMCKNEHGRGHAFYSFDKLQKHMNGKVLLTVSVELAIKYKTDTVHFVNRAVLPPKEESSPKKK